MTLHEQMFLVLVMSPGKAKRSLCLDTAIILVQTWSLSSSAGGRASLESEPSLLPWQAPSEVSREALAGQATTMPGHNNRRTNLAMLIKPSIVTTSSSDVLLRSRFKKIVVELSIHVFFCYTENIFFQLSFNLRYICFA